MCGGCERGDRRRHGGGTAPHFLTGLIGFESHEPGEVDNFVRQKKMARVGDRVVIVAGLSMTAPGTVNNLVIQTVGENMSGSERTVARRGV